MGNQFGQMRYFTISMASCIRTSSVRNTIRVQDEIDENYPEVEEDLIESVNLKETENDLLTYLLR